MDNLTKGILIALVCLFIFGSFAVYHDYINSKVNTVYFDIVDKFISGNQWTHGYYFVIQYNKTILDNEVNLSEYYSYEIGDKYPMVQKIDSIGNIFYYKLEG